MEGMTGGMNRSSNMMCNGILKCWPMGPKSNRGFPECARVAAASLPVTFTTKDLRAVVVDSGCQQLCIVLSPKLWIIACPIPDTCRK